VNICNKVPLHHIATTTLMDVMWLNTAAVGMLSLSPIFILQKSILPCIQCDYCCFDCSAHITDERNLHPVSDSSHPVKKKLTLLCSCQESLKTHVNLMCFVTGFNISLVV